MGPPLGLFIAAHCVSDWNTQKDGTPASARIWRRVEEMVSWQGERAQPHDEGVDAPAGMTSTSS
jgi:hypothetical protein